jgi:hypothetical protein
VLQCGWLFEFSGGRCITMIEDGQNFGLMLALRHLLGRLESKGMMSYPESQRMLDQALADVKRLGIEDKLTHEAAAGAAEIIGELYHRD